MSEERKKILRTQGKYADDKGNREKRIKESPSQVKLPVDENSEKLLNQSSFLSDSSAVESPVKYEENSSYKFKKLEPNRPNELKGISGHHVISTTHHGESSILFEEKFIDLDEGNVLYDRLAEEICWDEREIVIRGESHKQPRLVAWFGPFPYTYSGLTMEPAEIPDLILTLKDRIEDYLENQGINVTFNSVLLNLYRNNHDSVSWHSDDELSMGICPTIASVSLGETRKFEMRRKLNSYEKQIPEDEIDQLFIQLPHGSLLIMNGVMQLDWQHRVPKEYHDKDGRINLTFRTVYSKEVVTDEHIERLERSRVVQIDPTAKLSGEKTFSADDFPSLSVTVSCNDSATMSDVQANKSELSPVVSPNPGESDSDTDDKSIDKEDSDKDNSEPENHTFKYKFENKMYADQIQTNFNVNAPEFVPVSPSPVPTSQDCFEKMSFEELITHEVDAFDKQNYDKFTDALLMKIMDNLTEFNPYQQEEILFISNLMEGSRCPFTDKLSRDRLYVLAKRINDKGYKLYGKNKISRSPRDEPFSQRESSQKSRFQQGKPRNQEENSLHGERFSNPNRRSYGSQNDRPPSRRQGNYNKDDQWNVGTKNPKRNSRGEESWGEEKLSAKNTFSNKDSAWVEEHSAKKSSVDENVSSWLEATKSFTTVKVSSEEAWADEDYTHSNTNKGEGTWDNGGVGNNTHKKAESSWDDDGVGNNTHKKAESSWDDGNNSDSRQRRNQDYPRGRRSFPGSNENRGGRDFNKRNSAGERNENADFSDNRRNFENKRGSFRGRNDLRGERDFNKKGINTWGSNENDYSEKSHNRGSFRGMKETRGERNFNKGDMFAPRNKDTFDQRDSKDRNSGQRHFQHRGSYDGQQKWDCDRSEKVNFSSFFRGSYKNNPAPRFSNKREFNQSNNREETNTGDDFTEPTW